MRKLQIKKGDKVIIAIIKDSNASRYINMELENIDSWTFEGNVITVSKKYITVETQKGQIKFDIDDDYREKYIRGGADYKLYLSKDEIYNEIESENLYDEILSKLPRFGKPTLSLEALRAIKEIIDSEIE